jgi:hypothetical protein
VGCVGESKRTLLRGETMLTWRVLALLAAVSATLLLGGWAWLVRGQTSEGEEDHRRGGSWPVTLGITGDDETLFAGTCSVGEDERDVGGRVPRSFEFDLQGGELACEIRTDGAGGEFRIVLSDENSRFVHRSVGGGASVTRFVYEEGGISSMSSSTSQTMSTTTQESWTFLKVHDEARERGSGRPSLADRIQEDVDDSIERAMPWLRD